MQHAKITSPLLTEQEVAQLLRVNRLTVRTWRLNGEIPCIRIGRTVRYHRDSLGKILGHSIKTR